ncbi:filamentous hemagglutinin N-terminal domain-containing protein [Parasulfuritortus cantonensis]|nr:filamentous hemagglutinin N-terminal domain-containing protein [Parasulfuritortus cantonensis]
MLGLAVTAPAMALPTGEQVVSGNVDVATSGSNMTVTQTTDKGIINWDTYSIYSGESVSYLQPSSSSVTLNRIVGGDASEIFGQLSANGQIFLINPNGVLFAPGAQVSVGGLVASTLNISDDDFNSGHYVFVDGSGAGSVVNEGSLTGKYIALVAPTIDNSGSITADGGTVALAAGDRVSLDISGDGLMNVSVDAAAAGASINHSGAIIADGGQVLISARSADALMDTVLNVSGLVRAQSLSSQNGVIRLDGGDAGVVSVTGTLDASGKDAGETGGTVAVLGDKVGLFAGANIDASGDAGGGTVLVGGNYQGNGPEQNSSATFVGSGTSISADALTSGNGGKVIIWSDGVTKFYGQVSAQGGAESGDGGFAEVSGKGQLVYRGSVDLGASQGTVGDLLLDPTTITIADGTSDGDDSDASDTTFSNTTLAFAATPADYTIYESEIEGTDANIVLQATQSITLADLTDNALTLKTDRSLTLRTSNDTENGGITFADNGDAIVASGSGSILIQAGTTTGTAFTGGAWTGSISVGILTTAGGDITLEAKDGVTLNGNVNAGTGTVRIVADTLTQSAGTITAGSLGIQSLNAVSLTAANYIGTVAADVTGVGQEFRLQNEANGFVVGTVSGNGTIFTAVDGITTADTNTSGVASGSIWLSTTAGDISIDSAVTTGDASASGIGGAHTATSGSVTIAAGGSGSVFGTGGIVTGSATINNASGNDDAYAGSIDLSGNEVSANGTGYFNVHIGPATGGDGNTPGVLTVTTDGSGAAGEIRIASDADLQLGVLDTDAASSTAVDIAVTGGALTLTAASNLDTDNVSLSAAGIDDGTSGSLVVGGTLTLAATTGTNITLNNAANDFGSTVSVSDVNNVALTSANYIEFGDAAITGTLDATALNGAITQVGGTTMVVTGATTLDATGAVTLAQAGNDFSSVDVTGAAITLRDTNDLTISALSNGTNQSVDIRAGGTLTLPASAIDTGTANLTLASDGGTLATAADLSGYDISLTGSAGLALDHDITAGNDLSLTTTNADVTQGGTLTSISVTGATTVAAGNGAITLTHALNDFVGAVDLSGATTAVKDANALDLGVLNTGDLTVTALTGDLDLGSGMVDGALIATATTGNITELDGLGLTVTGATTLQAVLGNITATDTGNDFQGALSADGVDVAVTTGNDMVVADVSGSNSVTLTSSTGAILDDEDDATAISSPTVTLSAAGDIGSPNMVTGPIPEGYLDIDASTLTSLGLTMTGTGLYLNFQNSDISSSYMGGVLPAGLTDIGIAAADGSFTFDDATFGQTINSFNLDVYAQSIAFTYDGATGLFEIATSGDVSLTATTGAITDSVETTTVEDIGFANSVTLNAQHGIGDGNAIELADVLNLGATNEVDGAINVTDLEHFISPLNLNITGIQSAGDLILTADSLSQSAPIVVGGTTTLNTTAVTGSITWENVDNDFQDLVNLNAIGAVSLTDSNGLVLGTLSTGALTVVANAGGGTATLDLGAGTVASLDATSNDGDIVQTSALTVTGTATVDAGLGNITLIDVDNDFQGAVNLAGATTQVTDSNGLDLGTLSTGDLTVVANAGGLTTADLDLGSGLVDGTLDATSNDGNITQDAGGLTVTGVATLDAGAGSITLTELANDFQGTVNLTAASASVTDANGLTLGSLPSGALTVIANADGSSLGDLVLGSGPVGSISATSNGGDVSQSGALTVSGVTTVDAGAGDIDLSDAGNDFQGTVNLTGNNVVIVDADSLTLGTLSAASLDATSHGQLSLAGSGTVTGDTTLASNGGDVVQPVNAGTMVYNFNNLYVYSSGGNIYQAGSGYSGVDYSEKINVSGDMVLDAGAGFVDLWNDNSYFGTSVSATAGSTSPVSGVGVRLYTFSDLNVGLITAPSVSLVAVNHAINNANYDPVTHLSSGGNLDVPGSVTLSAATVGADAVSGIAGGGPAYPAGGLTLIQLPSSLNVYNSGNAAITVPAQGDLALVPHYFSTLNYAWECYSGGCTNLGTGESVAAAVSTISSILASASQDLFNSTFGTDNIRVSIQNGFLTQFGVVPPGIDSIDGDGVNLPGSSLALVNDPPAFLIDEEELKKRGLRN